MTTTHSFLGIAGALIYLMICGFCLRAAVSARATGRPPGEMAWWCVFTGLFVALIALRISGFEEVLRADLRKLLRQDGVYEMRREVQAPISALAVLCIAGLVALGAGVHLRTRPASPTRMLGLARLAIVGLCGLVLLRVISFHPVDRLLYGPAKLNWIIDIGSSLFAGWCAHRYTAIARRPRMRR